MPIIILSGHENVFIHVLYMHYVAEVDIMCNVLYLKSGSGEAPIICSEVGVVFLNRVLCIPRPIAAYFSIVDFIMWALTEEGISLITDSVVAVFGEWRMELMIPYQS